MKNVLRKLLIFCIQQKKQIQYILILLFLLLTALLITGKFNADLLAMLPRGSRSAELCKAVTDSRLFNKAVLLFHFEKNYAQEPLYRKAMDEIAEKALKDGTAVSVDMQTFDIKGISDGSWTRSIPQMVSPEQILKKDDNELSARAKTLYRQLLIPGAGKTEFLANDPFGTLNHVFQQFQQLYMISGLQIQPGNSHFISKDGHSAFLMLGTDVSSADPVRGAELLRKLEQYCTGLPAGMTGTVIAGHRHAVWNEKILKRDIRTVALLSLILFPLIFAFFYRMDWKSLIIPLIPVCVSIAVLGLMTLIFREILLFVAGMGGIIISLAVDYGIHIYSSMTSGKRQVRSVTAILPPLFTGALTSIAVFAMFLFSPAEGLIQLGFFTGFSLLLSCLVMVLVLPGILHGKASKSHRFERPLYPEQFPGIVLTLFGFFLLTGILLIPKLRFSCDLNTFDASPAIVQEQQDRFAQIFQPDGQPGIILCTAGDFDGMLKACEEASEKAGKANIPVFSVSELCPPLEVRKANVLLWQNQFSAIGPFEKTFEEAACKSGFRPNAFQPFFRNLEEGIRNPDWTPPKLLAPMLAKMSSSRPNAAYGIVFFPDTKENAEFLSVLGLPVLSKHTFSQQMAKDLFQAILLSAIAAFFAVILFVLLLLRKPARIWMAFLPPISAILAVLIFHVLCGIEANLASLIGGILLIGLAVDYGIFMISGDQQETFHAVTLSALTTAVGGLTVVFTDHPVLHSTGITLTVGILAAWLTAVLPLASVRELLRRHQKTLCQLLTAMLPLIFCGCSANPFTWQEFQSVPPITQAEDILIEMQAKMPRHIYLESKITAVVLTKKNALIGLTKLDAASGKIFAAGLTPTGAKIFEVHGIKGKTVYQDWFPGEWTKYKDAAAEQIFSAIDRVYFDGIPPIGTVGTEKNGKWFFETKNKETEEEILYEFAGEPVQLISKTGSLHGRTLWRVRYYNYFPEFWPLIPSEIYYESMSPFFQLILRNQKCEVLK